MALLVSFPQLTHAVTCLEVLHMDQRTSGAEIPVLSQEKASVII